MLQSQRADVHSVLVDGRVVKHQHRLLGVDLASVRRTVEQTVGHLRERLGEKEWQKGMDMPVPEEKALNFGVG